MFINVIYYAFRNLIGHFPQSSSTSASTSAVSNGLHLDVVVQIRGRIHILNHHVHLREMGW